MYNGWPNHEFQSLTRDSNHSNERCASIDQRENRFNPSRGIAIIQTQFDGWGDGDLVVSIPHAG